MGLLKLTQSRPAQGRGGFRVTRFFREQEPGCRDARGGYLKVVVRN